MQLLSWSVYLPDMSLIEHEQDLVDWRLARDLNAATLKDELCLRIQTIWNSVPETDIQNLFHFMPLLKQHLLQRVIVIPNIDFVLFFFFKNFVIYLY